MIRFIAALDSKNGIADDHGLPWQGLVPSDVAYYKDKLRTGVVLMGYGLYIELPRLYENEYGKNYVAVGERDVKLREGFIPVHDAREFIKKQSTNVWNAGGAKLFASTLDLADELYLTRLDQDFHCTKFFPAFEDQFELFQQEAPITENGVTFHFEIWRKKQHERQ